MQKVTLLSVLLSITVLFSSCKKTKVNPESGNVYIQYECAIDGFRDLKENFTLRDYIFTSEPARADWSRNANFNYVDSTKITALVRAGTVKSTVIHCAGNAPVFLPPGYHILDDGAQNPVGFWVDSSTAKPLIWMNSNYPYSPNHAEVKIVLKNYPPKYNLRWWFLGADIIDASTTADSLREKLHTDDDGADYDAGFVAMPTGGRSFRAPKGTGFVVVKTPVNTYQVARINVGEQETVTFTAP